MIKHMLLMKFNDHTSCEQLSKIQAGFLSVPEKIPGMLAVEWGTNNSPGRKRGGVYSLCHDDIYG
ncbi:Dabb family protein [Salmonella enterica subsp. enterica]